MRWIQYNTIASILNVPDAERTLSPFFLFSLALSLSCSRFRSPSLFFSTDGSTEERRKKEIQREI